MMLPSQKTGGVSELAYADGWARLGNDSLRVEVNLTEESILVEEFGVNVENEDLLGSSFSDTQTAEKSFKEAGYQLVSFEFSSSEISNISETSVKVTLHYDVQFTYGEESGYLRLSPYYYQNKYVEPTPTTPTIAWRPSVQLFPSENGSIDAIFKVERFEDGEVAETFKTYGTLASVGKVSGMEIHAISNEYNQKSETWVETEENQDLGKGFIAKSVKRGYSWQTNFTSTTGHEVGPKHEVFFNLMEEVTFTYEDYSYTFYFTGNMNTPVNKIEDKGKNSKIIEGTDSPYLGTFVLQADAYIHSADDVTCNGKPFFSSTAESDIYKRKAVDE